MKLYIASLFALRFDDNGNGFTSHTVTSCEAHNEDEARDRFLEKALSLYPYSDGYRHIDVALLEFGYNMLEEVKV